MECSLSDVLILRNPSLVICYRLLGGKRGGTAAKSDMVATYPYEYTAFSRNSTCSEAEVAANIKLDVKARKE